MADLFVSHGIRAAVEVPLTDSEGFGAAIGSLEATGEISRKEFGIDFNIPLEGAPCAVDEARLGSYLTPRLPKKTRVLGRLWRRLRRVGT